MSQHETRLARRRPAVLSLHHLDIGPAHTDGNGFHEHRTVADIRLRDFFHTALFQAFMGSTVIAFIDHLLGICFIQPKISAHVFQPLLIRPQNSAHCFSPKVNKCAPSAHRLASLSLRERE
ncbi:MAG: hypothetical protein MZV65_18440 [Chromatiales bacterium]|nr:hypothetical protein [Chromatiales bacterium]